MIAASGEYRVTYRWDYLTSGWDQADRDDATTGDTTVVVVVGPADANAGEMPDLPECKEVEDEPAEIEQWEPFDGAECVAAFAPRKAIITARSRSPPGNRRLPFAGRLRDWAARA